MILCFITNLGGLEILIICAIIGGIAGYYFRNKFKRSGKKTGILLGILGAVITTFLLVSYFFQALLVIPIYAILGAWLFNFVWDKLRN